MTKYTHFYVKSDGTDLRQHKIKNSPAFDTQEKPGSAIIF